ncbi:uncharacterized protein B0H64DRAFT_444326 [Chaetomium fimeti]|uniref:Uncharacterized protein n=1 Tax=Chaetomium fimeti TaxID=1854472 RepID=A0AAE0HAL3_9PEZI|nr:hypothetical protein B0H64DRAFT_444326 [Chaetomium fimeti]
MLFKQSVIAALMAAASLVLALPAPNTINLSVRDEVDYDADYKRSTAEMFVCKRDDNQSLSCLRKKSDGGDESKSANV